MLRDEAIPLPGDLPPSELFPESTVNLLASNENNLDDVWASADHENFAGDANHNRNEPSDIPRLRSAHSTAGYRDGISSAKSTTIQEGFDEGYSLGAVMGLEVGIILGVLEGIRNAIQDIESDQASEKRRVTTLLETARTDLQTEMVFGREWWGEDATWKYEVSGEALDGVGDFTFKEVVNSHPVISKWKRVVKVEAEKRGLDLTVMERGEEKRVASDDEG
jgi:hypothetical protein